jgi:hypothetical protein
VSVAALAASLVLSIAGPVAWAATLPVGPTRALTTPSAAAAVAADGDELVIDPGTYDDVAVFTQARLVIRAADPARRPRVTRTATLADGGALWTLRGEAIRVESIELFGARSAAQYGAALRLEGDTPTLLALDVHDNEAGVVGLERPQSDVTLERSTIRRNGNGTGFTHNVSIPRVRSLTARFNAILDARGGHDLRSRAATSVVAYNFIGAREGEAVSYEVEFPMGGSVFLVGNVIQQAASGANGILVSMATDGPTNPTQALYLVNNTLVNERGRGTFVVNRSGVIADMTNNLFVGGGAVTDAMANQYASIETNDPGFVDRAGFDYRLGARSAAIDRGTAPGMVGGRSLAPRFHFVEPAGFEPRPAVGAIDVGAFEFPDAVAPGDAGVGAPDAPPAADGAAADASPAADAVEADAEPAADVDPAADAEGTLDAGATDARANVEDPTRRALDGGCGCTSGAAQADAPGHVALVALALSCARGLARRRRRPR